MLIVNIIKGKCFINTNYDYSKYYLNFPSNMYFEKIKKKVYVSTWNYFNYFVSLYRLEYLFKKKIVIYKKKKEK